MMTIILQEGKYLKCQGLSSKKRWYQILLTCAAKPQMQNRNEVLQKAECILTESGRRLLFLEAQSDEDNKAQP